VEGSEFVLGVDQVVKAIGQKMTTVAALLGLATEKGKIRVNELLETNVAGIYAGGDCIRSRGAASTVMGVQDGKLAARAIDERLMTEGASHGGPEN
jgi:glutamate synthase (NADPH/NADH) small chain